MAQYTPNMKNCATCDYWGGQRETDRFGQRVFFSNPMDKGKCYNHSSGWAGSPGIQANGTCSHWQKWSALR